MGADKGIVYKRGDEMGAYRAPGPLGKRSAKPSAARSTRGGHRRSSAWPRAAVAALTLGVVVGLLGGCAPAAPASPTSAPAGSKPAEAKPAATTAQAPAAAPAGAAKTKPEPRGSVVIAVSDEPKTLESWEAYNVAGYPVLRNVQEALLNRDSKTNDLVGELATKWEATNATTWRFSLRQGVKFHDGSPFNAEAAAFGLNHMWKKDNNYLIRSFIGPELEAQAVDEHTLDVVTEAPDPILPSRLYFSPIPSMKALRETPDQYALKPVGTGPYRFVEWARGQHIKLEAYPDWWGQTAADAQGAASIKDATIVVRAEREVRTSMLRQGEADLARWITSEQCKGAPQCVSGPSIETVFLRLDHPNPAIADRRVREAIALAVDKSAIINDVMGGGTVARQLVGPSALGYNPILEPYPYDPERAKRLVAEAKAAGVPVDVPLTVLARRASYVRIEEAAEAAAEMLKQVGLTGARAQVLENAPHTDIWGAPKPIAPERGIIGIHSHGNEIMDFATSVNSYYRCEGRNSAYCDPAVDEMHRSALPLKAAEREKAYQDIAKYLHDAVATVPIGHPDSYYGLSRRLEWKDRLDGFILLKEMTLKE